jgi:predicted nuclease of predicted toxin-antitoxin system
LASSVYLDHHVHSEIRDRLIALGIDCLTVNDDGRAAASDEDLLRRAVALNRVMLTYDHDFDVIHARWMKAGRNHNGIIRVNLGSMNSSELIEDIALLLIATDPTEFANTLRYVPLR